MDQGDGTYKFRIICTTCGYTKLISTANAGDIGPAGGIVFYDKGEYSDGWRFLEAAPADLRVVHGNPSVDSTLEGYSNGSMRFVFGYFRTTSGGSNLYVNGTTTYNAADCTRTAVGTGKTNTDLLVTAMGDNTYSESTGKTKTTQYAAKLCADLEYNGFDDWFLPSADELDLVYTNLHKAGLGGFAGDSRNSYEDSYWSSSEEDPKYASRLRFNCGPPQIPNVRYKDYRVRPVRAF